MGIRVEHGPSMVPVGQLAYRTGQNEYIDKRRQELEAQQEQQANRNLKSQMQANDINSGFQQIQMQHEQGMQRAAAQNLFQLDRDQKNHDWQVNAAADLFNNQKDLNDQSHEQGLDRIQLNNDLSNEAMIKNNQSQAFTKTIDRLYSSSNQAGRGEIDAFQSQMLKLQGHVTSGKITQEDYDAQYSQGASTLVSTLTGKSAPLYQIGAQYQTGGTSVINGGATIRTVGEGGSFFYEDNLAVDPATGVKMTQEEYDLKYNAVQYDDDGIPFRHENDNITGQRKRVNMTQEFIAKNNAKQKALELAIKQRAAEQAAEQDGAMTLERVNKKVAGLTTAYEGRLGPRPVVGEFANQEDIDKLQEWEDGLRAFKNDRMTPEEIRMGGGEPAAQEGMGQPDLLDVGQMGGGQQFGQPDVGGDADYNNKLNFLNSMNV